MKVFNVDENDWYAGENLEEVEAFVKKQREHDNIDDEVIEIVELEKADLDRFQFFIDPDDRYETITFQERLDFLIEQKEKFPCFFATSEY